MDSQTDDIEREKKEGEIDRYFHAPGSGESLLGVFHDGLSYPFYFSRGLLSSESHDFHELRRHFSSYLILNTPIAIRIRLEKPQDLFLSNSRRFQPVEKFAVARSTAQLLDTSQQFSAIETNPRPNPGSFSTEVTT